MTTPPAEDQIRFLNNLQRLLSEGGFTATYKFALLLALADLSVELEHPEASAIFHINDIAAKYIEYYWRHTAPYIQPNRESPRAFFQNTNPGKEARVLALILLSSPLPHPHQSPGTGCVDTLHPWSQRQSASSGAGYRSSGVPVWIGSAGSIAGERCSFSHSASYVLLLSGANTMGSRSS